MSSDVKTHSSPLKIIPSPDLNGSLNIFIGNIQKENTCIICLDSDNLIQNDRCSCIYHFHQSCIEKIKKPNHCILCKKEWGIAKENEQDINIRINVQHNPSCCSVLLCFFLLGVLFVCIYSMIKFI